MKRIIALVILFLPSLAFGVTYINTVPYNCNKTGEAYVLAKDVWTTGTAITISADNIILNLNDKTITFGTANGKCNGIETTWNRKNIEIFGGKIKHGGIGNPPGCNGIFIQETTDKIKVHDLNIMVKSRADATDQSCGILMKRARDPEVYGCTIDNQASEVINRHSIPALGIDCQLTADTPSNFCRVYGNKVKSTHMGIRMTGAWASVRNNPMGNECYNNFISINQCGSTNGYALLFISLSGLVAYNNGINNMTERGGRGIIISYCNNFDIHHNTITSREGRTNESFQTNGIRLRWSNRYGKIHDNTVNVYAGQTADFGDAYGIYITAAVYGDIKVKDAGVEVSNNTINAITYDVNKIACGLHFELMDKGSQFVFKDNIINTNSRGIKLESSWNGVNNCEDLKLYRTKIARIPENSSNFQVFELTGERGAVKDIFMIDTLYGSGASEDMIYVYPHLSVGELTHVSTCKFGVKDIRGIPVPGATIGSGNRLGERVVHGTTDSKGEYVSEVSYKKYSKSAGKIDFNPVTLTASYDCRVGSKQINVSNINKEFSVNLPSKKTFPCP